jgi:hypothetical protein
MSSPHDRMIKTILEIGPSLTPAVERRCGTCKFSAELGESTTQAGWYYCQPVFPNWLVERNRATRSSHSAAVHDSNGTTCPAYQLRGDQS